MASSINASTGPGGGVATTADASGNLNLQSNGSTVVAVTATGATVTGTLAATGAVSGTTGTFTSTLGVTGAITGSSTVAGSTGILYPLTSGTAVASTSGTSIDFTSIPSWVKSITVMFNGVSISGTSYILIQLGGSGGAETSGYSGYSSYLQGGGGASANTNGFNLYGIGSNAAAVIYGSMVCTLVSGNIWVANGFFQNTNSWIQAIPVGGKTTSATLDRIRITTNNGTDTFDAGSINILYE